MRAFVLVAMTAAVATASELAAPPRADVEELGPELAAQNCHMCHSPELLDQQRLTVKQWQAVVKKMEGWGAPLEEGEQEILAAYLASRHPADPPSPFVPSDVSADEVARLLAPAEDPPLPAGSADRGASLFASRCAACHGIDGRGGRTGTNLVGRLSVRRGSEVKGLLFTGRHRMPAFETTDAELADLLAFLRGLSR